MNIAGISSFEGTSIRAVIPCPGGGQIVMAGFPGLGFGVDGEAYIDPEHQRETLTAMRSLGVKSYCILTQPAELPSGADEMLLASCGQVGLTPERLPIVDFGVPDETWMARWKTMQAGLLRALDLGQSLGCSCQYGAGRSGLLASYILILRGMSADDAVAAVRARYSKAVESPEQERWLQQATP